MNSIVEFNAPNKPSPVICTINDINERSYKKLRWAINKACNMGQTLLPIVIDSRGGEAYPLLGMLNLITNSPITIVTVCEAKAFSAGAILFAYGEHRFISEDAVLMIHEMSAGDIGKVSDISNSVGHTRELNEKIYKKMAKQIGKPEGFFLKKISGKKNVDWFIYAEEAKKINLATQIGVPHLKMTVNASYDLVMKDFANE